MICCLCLDPLAPGHADALDAIARACSPLVERHGDRVVLFDVQGLSRLVGTPVDIAREVQRLAADHGIHARLAVASTAVSAWLLAHARPGTTVTWPRPDAEHLARLPLECLRTLPETDVHEVTDTPAALRRRRAGRHAGRIYRMAPGPQSPPPIATAGTRLAVLERWGLGTLGDLARLPRADVHTRLGAPGVRWHQAACGEDTMPLVASRDLVRFLERCELEWPIEGLEPLSFVLARMGEALSAALERADRGAVEVTTRLRLVTRETHERVLHLPAPMRDARVLRTLILLDLESHPPPAGIDVVEVELGVAPARIVHGTLFTRADPAPEAIATLVARLAALMGESRVGAPVRVETHDGRAVAMAPFHGRDPVHRAARGRPSSAPIVNASAREATPASSHDRTDDTVTREWPIGQAVRRFRLPIPARVVLDHGRPVRVDPSARGLPGGPVIACAGPWRSSGRWWALDHTSWDRDEWEVELPDSVYRLARQRDTGAWFVDGLID